MLSLHCIAVYNWDAMLEGASIAAGWSMLELVAFQHETQGSALKGWRIEQVSGAF